MVARTLPFKSRDKPKPNEPLPSISCEMQRQIKADQTDIKKQLNVYPGRKGDIRSTYCCQRSIRR